jgi:hypothetical protein
MPLDQQLAIRQEMQAALKRKHAAVIDSVNEYSWQKNTFTQKSFVQV